MTKYDLKTIYEWPISTRALVAGLICVLVYFFGNRIDISPLKMKLLNSQQQELNLKQQIELMLSQQVAIKNEISKFSQHQKMLIEWQNKLIKYPDLPELLNQILKIGSTNQLHFALFSPGAETKEDLYSKVPIKVVVVGGYHQLADFISQVANLPQLVAFGDFTVSKENKSDVLGVKLTEQANAQNQLTAEFILDIYYFAEKN